MRPPLRDGVLRVACVCHNAFPLGATKSAGFDFFTWDFCNATRNGLTNTQQSNKIANNIQKVKNDTTV
jgi:hypothetical protein